MAAGAVERLSRSTEGHEEAVTGRLDDLTATLGEVGT